MILTLIFLIADIDSISFIKVKENGCIFLNRFTQILRKLKFYLKILVDEIKYLLNIVGTIFYPLVTANKDKAFTKYDENIYIFVGARP